MKQLAKVYPCMARQIRVILKSKVFGLKNLRRGGWISARKKGIEIHFFSFDFYRIVLYPLAVFAFNDSLNPATRKHVTFIIKLLNLFLVSKPSTGDSVSSVFFFSIKINRGCDAIEAMVFSFSITCFSCSLEKKLSDSAGLFFSFVMNLLRIVLFFNWIYWTHLNFTCGDMADEVFILFVGTWLF